MIYILNIFILGTLFFPFTSSILRPLISHCVFMKGWHNLIKIRISHHLVSQGCIFRLTCSHRELTEGRVLISAYVKIFRTITRNVVNKSVWRKKDCSWLPLNKHAMNIWLSSLRIRAHLSWRTGKHLHVLHVLQTYPTCSYPGYQDTTTYAALPGRVRAGCQKRCLEKALVHRSSFAVCILNLPELIWF